MATAVWTVLAVAVMIAIFGGCVVVVAVAVRLYEGHLAKRRERLAAP